MSCKRKAVQLLVLLSQNTIYCTALWFMTCSLTPTSFLVELPVLDNEMYHAVKPGLSAYKDNPEEVRMCVYTVTYY